MRSLAPSLLLLLGACQLPAPVQDPQADPVSEPVSEPEPSAELGPGSAGLQPVTQGAAEAIGAMIDDWHQAAAEADQGRYLGHFTEDAVFLGTDATERWTLEEFTGYVETYFPKGGWAYTPHHRHVLVSADGGLAWFDEQLTNAGYGELRGTGVARWVDGSWKLAHYSMTFTVPNEVAGQVVEVIRSQGEGPR